MVKAVDKFDLLSYEQQKELKLNALGPSDFAYHPAAFKQLCDVRRYCCVPDAGEEDFG